NSGNSSLPDHNPGANSASAVIYRSLTPFESRHEQRLYHALRNYYDAAFSTRRWAFDGDNTIMEQDYPAHRLAAEQTSRAMSRGEEIYGRFRAAVGLLERPSRGNNGGKEGDFAQGARLMRIAFAELSIILSSVEPPLLPLWMIYIMVLLRESSARDFRPIANHLIKYLHELTWLPLTNGDSGRPRHPTAQIWNALWSGGGGFAPDRRHLLMCSTVAVEQFSQHIGYFHPWTVDLSGLSIGLLHPNGVGDHEDKTIRFRDLLQQLESLDVYDDRHITTVCCLASHYRHHGSKQDKARAVHACPEGAFNMYSLLGSTNYRLGRLGAAEDSIRRAIELAMAHWARTREDGDLFEGLNGLEVILRAQGKNTEANAVQEERKMLVRKTLEMMGETDDSA
ncbi:hypothetical protein GQ53DRAFT_860048, partial [Thozetella sp. PMI_491]